MLLRKVQIKIKRIQSQFEHWNSSELKFPVWNVIELIKKKRKMKTMKANGSFLSLLRHSFVGGKQKTGIGLSFGYLEMDDDSVPAAFFSLAQWRQGCAFRTPSGRWFECSFLANKRPIFCPFISTIWFPPLWRTDIPFFRLSWSPFGGNCPECALFLIARLLSEDKGKTLLHYSLLEAENLL